MIGDPLSGAAPQLTSTVNLSTLALPPKVPVAVTFVGAPGAPEVVTELEAAEVAALAPTLAVTTKLEAWPGVTLTKVCRWPPPTVATLLPPTRVMTKSSGTSPV